MTIAPEPTDSTSDDSPPRRVLVTGSRDWTDDYLIWMHLNHLNIGPFVLIHGACSTGADRHAVDWAECMSNPVERHPADWAKHGRAAGPRRNQEMVNRRADLCLAYIGICTSPRCTVENVHASHGATGCADLAERAGIEVRRYYDPRLQVEVSA